MRPARSAAPSQFDLARLADLEAALAIVRDRVAALEGEPQDHHEAAELRAELHGIRADHQRSLQVLEKERAGLRAGLDRRLEDIENALDDLRVELGARRPAPTSDGAAIAGLVERVDQLEAEDAELASAIVKLRRRHQELTQDLTALATSMGELAEALMPARLRR